MEQDKRTMEPEETKEHDVAEREEVNRADDGGPREAEGAAAGALGTAEPRPEEGRAPGPEGAGEEAAAADSEESTGPSQETETLEETSTAAPGQGRLVNFGGLEVLAEVYEGLKELGYAEPMEVQREAFGPIMEGNHVVVQSQTGSGKTAAFGIPLMNGLVDPESGAVQALVLCPTRELARQVCDELAVLGKHRRVNVTPIYGGTPIEPQVRALQAGTQVVVGTPGRVLDHLKRGTLDPSELKVLVLDECDEMLSMGFQKEVDEILSRLPEGKQVLLFSATITEDVDRILRRLDREPVFVRLSGDSVAAKEVDHYVYLVTEGPRHRELVRILENEQVETAIVFCNTREEVNMVASYLKQRGWKAEAISSDLTQRERERVMARMRQGKIRILVATDVAARGIDLPHVTHVINYTFPESAEIYVHRTGRTGRAGRAGTAISLIGPRELGSLYYMQLTYGIRPVEKRLPTEQELASQREGERFARLVEEFAEEPPQEFVSLSRRLWHSAKGERVFAHLLAQYFEGRRKSGRSSRKKEKKEKKSERRAGEPARKRSQSRESGRRSSRREGQQDTSVRLYVNLGRRDGLKADQICALIEEAAGISPSAILSARVHDSHTYLTVDPNVVDRILEEAQGLTVQGRRVVVERARSKR